MLDLAARSQLPGDDTSQAAAMMTQVPPFPGFQHSQMAPG